MAPRKLSDSDKQDILTLYHQTDETISSLAARYGVSNTTISRILKQSLPEQEYETLIQQKRTAVKAPADKPAAAESPELPAEPLLESEAAEPPAKPSASPQRRRSRPKAAEKTAPATAVSPPILASKELAKEPPAPAVAETQLPLLELSAALVNQNPEPPLTAGNGSEEAYPSHAGGLEPHPLEDAIAGDLLSADEDFADDLDDEDDEDDLDEDDEDDLDEEDDEDDGSLISVQVQSKAFIQVLPLSEATIPKTCYLVVDRASELVTRPLRDFAELGQIPTEEVQAKTLPVFDNHRVARRYSRRMQRVVKVPDGKILQKVGAYLQAKGITRLLIDGQVYSLDMEPT